MQHNSLQQNGIYVRYADFSSASAASLAHASPGERPPVRFIQIFLIKPGFIAARYRLARLTEYLGTALIVRRL
jgi:hypothetical protein